MVVLLLSLAMVSGGCGQRHDESKRLAGGAPSAAVHTVELTTSHVSEELRDTIIDEAVSEMHPTIAAAVNEAVEECEQEAQAAIEDFQSCLMVQFGELLEDALLVCTPDPPSCDKW